RYHVVVFCCSTRPDARDGVCVERTRVLSRSHTHTHTHTHTLTHTHTYTYDYTTPPPPPPPPPPACLTHTHSLTDTPLSAVLNTVKRGRQQQAQLSIKLSQQLYKTRAKHRDTRLC